MLSCFGCCNHLSFAFVKVLDSWGFFLVNTFCLLLYQNIFLVDDFLFCQFLATLLRQIYLIRSPVLDTLFILLLLRDFKEIKKIATKCSCCCCYFLLVGSRVGGNLLEGNLGSGDIENSENPREK